MGHTRGNQIILRGPTVARNFQPIFRCRRTSIAWENSRSVLLLFHLLFILLISRNRCRSVGIVTKLQDGRPRNRVSSLGMWKRFYPFYKASRPTLGPTPPPQGALYSGVKRTGRETHHYSCIWRRATSQNNETLIHTFKKTSKLTSLYLLT